MMINRVPTKNIKCSAEIERQTAEFLKNGGTIAQLDSSANANKPVNLSDFTINQRSGTGKKSKPVDPKTVGAEVAI